MVKATRRSIDEPPGIEVGMFEFGDDFVAHSWPVWRC
jgi:hypothetical protein